MQWLKISPLAVFLDDYYTPGVLKIRVARGPHETSGDDFIAPASRRQFYDLREGQDAGGTPALKRTPIRLAPPAP
jgi:hypothetical protein